MGATEQQIKLSDWIAQRRAAGWAANDISYALYEASRAVCEDEDDES